jgi:hypothetical protein
MENAIFLGQVCRKCASKIRGNNHHTKENFVGCKFNSLIITKQYVGKNNKTMVDCLCDCGKIVTTTLWNVKLNRVGSCGCQRNKSIQLSNSPWKRKPYGWSSFNTVYNRYVAGARPSKRRSFPREFLLTRDDAMKLFRGNCFYCGVPPSKVSHPKKCYGEFIYNGIDRKDSGKGYTLDNCVSCCEFCNMTKNDTPFDEFIEWIRRVYKNITK